MPLEARVVHVFLTCILACKLADTAMPDKIVQNLHIFDTNQHQIAFLLLQDAILEIFVPKIKYLAIEVK